MIVSYSSVNENDVFYAINSVVAPSDLCNKTIVLKPNVRSIHKYEKGKNTSPFTLEKVIKFFKQNYNNKIIVCDGSIIGVDTIQSALISGIFNVCEKYSIEFIDVKKTQFIDYNIEILPYKIEISAIIDNAYIVNIPKLKTTYATPLSLSIKNLKGLLSDKSKKDFHRHGLNELLVELSKLIKSNISVIDADIVLSLDTPIESKMIIATDGFEEGDIYIAQKLGFSLTDIKYLDIINCRLKHTEIEEKYFNMRNGLQEIGLKFITPVEYLSRNNINIIGNPCSGCCGCIFKALEKSKFNETINIVAGFNSSNCQINNSFKTIAVGNCSNKNIRNRVTGCPPMISEIIELIKEENI